MYNVFCTTFCFHENNLNYETFNRVSTNNEWNRLIL